jgi:hypothetical protein
MPPLKVSKLHTLQLQNNKWSRQQGIFRDKEFACTDRCTKFVRLQRDGGTEPAKVLLSKSRKARSVRLPMHSGRLSFH